MVRTAIDGAMIRIGFILILLCAIVYSEDYTDIGAGTDMSFEDLTNIKITVASKSEEGISDAPGVISVIMPDELRRFGATTLGDILKRIPSFIGSSVYMTDRSMISARGDQVMPSSSHILMLINGRPVREIQEGGIKSEMYESFPISVIERIEVVRGPGSVLYGSQAFSAVINIVTKSPDKNGVTITGLAGGDNTGGLCYNTMADLAYKLGDFGMVLGVRYANKGEWDLTYEAPGPPPGVPGFDPTFLYKVDVSIPDKGPGVYGELSFKGLKAMGAYTTWEHRYFVPDYMFVADMLPGYDNSMGVVDYEKWFTDVGYEHTFSDVYNASVNVTYNHSILDVSDFPLTSRNSYELLAEITNFITPIENMNVVIGAVGGLVRGVEKDKAVPDSVNLTNAKHSIYTFSGYAQADYRFLDMFKVIAGVQLNKVRAIDSLDEMDDFDVDVNPRVGVILYPLDKIDIKALYSQAYRAPSLDELYLDHYSMRGKMAPKTPDDPNYKQNLKPEKVHTYDLGANYHGEQVHCGMNAFYSRMWNLIIQDRDPTHFAIPTWDNIGEVSIFGIECEGKYYCTKELLFEGSFLYQQSRDKNTHQDDVTPLPNFSVKGGLSYCNDYGFTISMFNVFQEGLDTKYSSTLNKTTEYFHMLNLYCSYDFNTQLGLSQIKQLSAVVNIDNLLDEEVWLPAWGLINGSTIPYNKGRRIYSGVEIAF